MSACSMYIIIIIKLGKKAVVSKSTLADFIASVYTLSSFSRSIRDSVVRPSPQKITLRTTL